MLDICGCGSPNPVQLTRKDGETSGGCGGTCHAQRYEIHDFNGSNAKLFNGFDSLTPTPRNLRSS